jgi:hypothetical protein
MQDLTPRNPCLEQCECAIADGGHRIAYCAVLAEIMRDRCRSLPISLGRMPEKRPPERVRSLRLSRNMPCLNAFARRVEHCSEIAMSGEADDLWEESRSGDCVKTVNGGRSSLARRSRTPRWASVSKKSCRSSVYASQARAAALSMSRASQRVRRGRVRHLQSQCQFARPRAPVGQVIRY